MIRLILILALCLAASLSRAADLTTHELEARLTDACRKVLPSDFEVHVENVFAPKGVPKGSTLELGSPSPPLGLIRFTLRWNDGRLVRRLEGSATVKAQGLVAVTRAPVKPGDRFGEHNTTFEKRELSAHAHSGYFMGKQDLTELSALGYLRPGTLLDAQNTQAPFAVTPGQWVELIHQNGALKIVARMKALASGRPSQWIRVENPSTRKVVNARVVSPGIVSLN